MRCPFRMAALDHPDTCDPKCAWLVKATTGDYDWKSVCAMTLIGKDTYRVPMNRLEDEG